MAEYFYSDIVKGETQILKHYEAESKQKHSGIDLAGQEIYSVCQGVVIDISKHQDYHCNITYCVTIQVTESQCIRYGHLSIVTVDSNQVVSRYDEIGVCSKYVHLEYLTRNMPDSIWPVRIGDVEYYKHDPTVLVDGSLKFEDQSYYDVNKDIEIVTNHNFEPMIFTDEMSKEFSGNA